MEVKAEYLAIFAEEAAEQLREWEGSLLALEKDPGSRDPVDALFRAIHTLKGSSGFIGFDRLQKLAHGLESVLADVRDGTRSFTPALGEVLFKGLDVARDAIDVFSTGGEVAVDVDGLLERLEEATGSNGQAGAGVQDNGRQAPQAPATSAVGPALVGARRLLVSIDGAAREAYLRSFVVKARLEKIGRIVSMDPQPETLSAGTDPFRYTVVLESDVDPSTIPGLLSLDQVTVTLVAPGEAGPAAQAETVAERGRDGASPSARDGRAPAASPAKPDEVVRVSVHKLDALLNLVGELVIHNSGFVSTAQQLREQHGKTPLVADLEEKTEALAAITSQLQDGIMKARMLPVASVFGRFQRVVRDLARAGGKTVSLEVFGEETEIDKKVIDRIGEPLVHLVRNAVDHGLEATAARTARGKNPTGTIRLGAYQEGDHICIEVSDDGKGLDRDAILRKAMEKGLLGAEEAATASEERVLGFIFLPGFSTANVVSDISGRGVGMDAVRRAVDEMNGSVRVRSEPGRGTTVTISLPLTMAIITAVLVEVDGSVYAIPLSTVKEIVKTRESTLRSVGARQVLLLRDEVLALVRLGRALEGRTEAEAAAERPGAAGDGAPVVVVESDGLKIGLEVNRILGTRDVVIKSLGRHYREVEGLIGASILGNGQIALITDVEALVRRSRSRTAASVAADRGGSAAAVAVKQDAPCETVAPCPEEAAAPVTEGVRPSDAIARLVEGTRIHLLDDVNNDGAIQASLSLSQFTGQEVRVSFPETRLTALRDVPALLGGEEATVGGIYVGVQGDIAAGVLLVLPEKNLLQINDLLHGRAAGSTRQRSEVDLSALSELGNILSSCFINAISDAARVAAGPAVPEISVDMCLAVIDSVLARFNRPGERILLTEATIYGSGMEDVVCHQLFFVEPDSLARLLDALTARAPAPAGQR